MKFWSMNMAQQNNILLYFSKLSFPLLAPFKIPIVPTKNKKRK